MIGWIKCRIGHSYLYSVRETEKEEVTGKGVKPPSPVLMNATLQLAGAAFAATVILLVLRPITGVVVIQRFKAIFISRQQIF